MILGQVVFRRLEETWRGNRACDEFDRDRIETLRRERFRQQPRLERVTVARDGHQPGNAMFSKEAQNLSPFDAIVGPVVSAELGVAGCGPTQTGISRQVLKIQSPVEHANRIAPELPGRSRSAQPSQE